MTLIPNDPQMKAETALGLRVTLSRLTPEDVPQARRDPAPISVRSRLRYPDYPISPDLPVGRVGRLGRRFVRRSFIRTRSVSPHPSALRWAGAERRHGCSASRFANSNREHQFGRQALADRSPSHFVRLRKPSLRPHVSEPSEPKSWISLPHKRTAT